MPERADDPLGLVWFQTSGTTGRPKWIGHGREGLLLSAAMVNRHLGVKESDTWGLALPLHHVGGFGVVARAYEMGCGLETFRGKWEPGGFCEWLSAACVHHLSLVPTQVHDLVEAGKMAPSCLKTVVVGGGVLNERAGQAARNLGWPVLASYGMTEAASQVATQSPDLLEVPYQISRLPVLPQWQARAGDDGCLELGGRCLFVATLEEDDEGWSFLQREGEWHVTSDRVKLDAGCLTILGRVDRSIKVLGELVNLDRVEQGLGLDGVAVVGVPDERQGSRLVVYSERGDVSDAIDRYNSEVAGPWRVGECIQLDRLPRTAMGKIRYADL
jgi:O-succinylbenzoic acid--CoA ligase